MALTRGVAVIERERDEQLLPSLPDRQRRVDFADGCIYMLQHRTRHFTAGLLEEALGVAELGIGGGLRFITLAAVFSSSGIAKVGCAMHTNIGCPLIFSHG